ncbi:phosphoribosylamine--glycine ligase [Candidatus Woesearchaeota archaeon]|nr:phosphoribosylamine--glycine ligase [Candidatus Woesearchaeota archaeon]
MKMRVMVIGGGAREHAIADALVAGGAEVYVYMPMLNPGIKRAAKGYAVGPLENTANAVELATKYNIELVVIGPEAPLAAGAVNELEKTGVACVGPTKELAQLETSKAFTRNLLRKYGIEGNPEFKIFDNSNKIEILGFLTKLDSYVIKPDGLTGGKGVKVMGEHLHSNEEALAYCSEVLETHPAVIVEEKLEGQEFSLQTLTDGTSFVHFPVVQDHKRAYENDEGPNTGGMGSYSDANHLLPFLTSEDVEKAKEITVKAAAALKQELGLGPYKGVMYGGFMKTREGIKLLEYNARFGDPEAMNVLPLLKTNFADMCKAAADGKLAEINVEFHKKASVCKYVVPEGYPDNPQTGIITVPSCEKDGIKALVYYASVEERGTQIYTTKSRGVAFVGIADSIEEAERIAEEAAGKVHGSVYHRRDIGTAALIQKRVEHANSFAIKQLYKPKAELMKVAAFMSGRGSTLQRILQQQDKAYEVAMIFSDTADESKCNARKIAEEYGIPYYCNDIREYYGRRNADRSDMAVRKEYDKETLQLLKKHNIDAVALCGYLSIVTAEIYGNYLTLNVHPADLRVIGSHGKKMYAGCIKEECIQKALDCKASEARATVHIVTEGVDEGPVIKVSAAVPLDGESVNKVFEQVTEAGRKIYPESLQALSLGHLWMEEELVINIEEEKSLLREKMRQLRDKLSSEQVRSNSSEITKKLLQLHEYEKAKTVMFYMGVNSEVHTDEAIRQALASKSVAIPVTDQENRRIIAAQLESLEKLRPGAYGIPEPAETKEISPEEIDIAVVPGIAFDSSGNRIGYGLGYFDKFLKQTPATKIGLAHESQIVDKIRAAENDVAVDKIITEKRTIECR